MDVGPALIVCFLMVSMTAVKSQIREGPKNALKIVGDNVTLRCVTVNTNCDRVDWQKVEGLQSPKLVYRNGAGMLNNDIYPPQRYSVNSTDGCSLTITQLEINDSGRFICMQAVDSGEETKSSILVVINVKESCLSNVTSNALDKGDGISLWCAINIPAKSVEPWNVTLSFHNRIVGETETTDENQPLIVKTTLTGIATNENITRVCRASFPHNTQANYDNTTATLDVCTKQWIVSCPPPICKCAHSKSGTAVEGDARDECTYTGYVAAIVICVIVIIIIIIVVVFIVVWKVESCPGHVCLHSIFECGCRSDCIGDAVCCACIGCGIICCHHSKKKNDYPVANIFISVSPPGPDKGITVRCTAEGHPPPTFKWTHLTSGKVVCNDTLVINSDVGDKYTCTATNTVKGKETSQCITIEVTPLHSEALGPVGIAGIVTGIIITIGGVVVGVVIVGPKKAWWLHPKEKNDENGERAYVPLKLPRKSDAPEDA